MLATLNLRKRACPTRFALQKCLRVSTVFLVLSSIFLLGPSSVASARENTTHWRAATEKELEALLPARATVEKEHIETEMRTASGITDGQGRFLAGIVLITAGYSADGKYSHYLVTQVPLQIGGVTLAPGEYVFGWQRDADALQVQLYDALTGAPRGSARAERIKGNSRVESFRIWPPENLSAIQIGRFGLPYHLGK